MDDGLRFLILFAILAGGAVVATLLAALGVEWPHSGDEKSRDPNAPSRGKDRETGVEEDLFRLVATEAKIGQLSQLLAFVGQDAPLAGRKDLLARQRVLLAYLIDTADKSSALLLRRSYREEVGWLLALLDEYGWIETISAFRSRIVREHLDLASKPYFREHPALDAALEDILADLDDEMSRLAAKETVRFLDDESPITEAAVIKLGENEEISASTMAQLDRAFDRFAASLEMR